MKQNNRLTSNKDIQHVRQNGKYFAHPILVISILPNRLEYNRIAVIAGRPVGGAVQRNYAKRRIRSAVNRLQTELMSGYDLIIIARSKVIDVDYNALMDIMKDLMKRAGLLRD